MQQSIIHKHEDILLIITNLQFMTTEIGLIVFPVLPLFQSEMCRWLNMCIYEQQTLSNKRIIVLGFLVV